MVMDRKEQVMPRTQHVVVAGSESGLGAALVDLYETTGAHVSALRLDGDAEAQAARLAGRPIDLLVFADDLQMPARRTGELRRDQFAPALSRLAFKPSRVANLLRPELAMAGGKLVLLSRRMAGMTVQDPAGTYLERPFRAAAHALWRSLSVEWQPDIACVTIALDGLITPDGALLATIASATSPPGGAPLLDHRGNVIPW